jgi:hypothetical protein
MHAHVTAFRNEVVPFPPTSNMVMTVLSLEKYNKWP